MYYFAYGSNLEKEQMKERCPDSKPLFSAILPNYQLFFCGWSRQWRGGKASIRKTTGTKVRGAVYEVSQNCLSRLDRLEGLDYHRIAVIVFDEDGDAQEATTYMTKRPLEETKPGKDYLETILRGYRDWQIE
ncbi:MAG: gamma-glutamylcyclotransferase family protein [Dehalococcoidales bacterium]|jgi:gamma-glutamylcyclotransferase (GGCT)/AIG2-like uncharacterized protein YtfP